MTTKTKVVALIPARGGSKSIPLKNIKLFCGKPLIYWGLFAAEHAALIDEVYLATESDEIRRVAEGFGFSKVRVIPRGPETITDTASTESVMLEFARQHEFDHIVLVQATSPLIKPEELDGGLEKYFSEKYDSLLSLVPQKRFIWELVNGQDVRAVNYDIFKRPRRQDFNELLVENGSFYITSKKRLLETGNRLSGRIGFYAQPACTYHELDEVDDWSLLESIANRKKS